MSGHSKWHNIQKTKGAADAKRSAAFTKIAKEIIVAVKQGGSGDPANNSRLATVIAKAKANNMPNDNIKRTIDKALGSGNTDNYESVTYEGVGATKKWERIESYGPKFVENIVQAISRDILCYAMRTLSHCFICGHVHDELIIECDPSVSLEAVCEQMGRTLPWLPGIELRADGYECAFYQKQ